MSDRVPGFHGALRLYPSLRDGAVDNVPLNPFAFGAGKRSKILARRARLNRRQRHRRTACHALRTLVLCVEHELSPRYCSDGRTWSTQGAAVPNSIMY